LSPNRYSNVFKESTGTSPQQYLIDLRLQKAKELLSHTSLNIRQIASLTGFNNQLYLSRLFKKYESIPPSDYAKNLNSK
jgi:transcriptional regulator GlxA family with amidase domain